MNRFVDVRSILAYVGQALVDERENESDVCTSKPDSFSSCYAARESSNSSLFFSFFLTTERRVT